MARSLRYHPVVLGRSITEIVFVALRLVSSVLQVLRVAFFSSIHGFHYRNIAAIVFIALRLVFGVQCTNIFALQARQ